MQLYLNATDVLEALPSPFSLCSAVGYPNWVTTYNTMSCTLSFSVFSLNTTDVKTCRLWLHCQRRNDVIWLAHLNVSGPMAEDLIGSGIEFQVGPKATICIMYGFLAPPPTTHQISPQPSNV